MKTFKEIAELTGRSKTAVRKHMEKLGISPVSIDSLPEDHPDRKRLRSGTFVFTDEDCGALIDSITGNVIDNQTGNHIGINSDNITGNQTENELITMIFQEKENRIRELQNQLQKTEDLLEKERDRVDWLLTTINNQAIVIAQSKAETLPETVTDNREPEEEKKPETASDNKTGILNLFRRIRKMKK